MIRNAYQTELVDLIYNKVGKNKVLRIEHIQQELNKPEKREQNDLDEE